jgi:DNA-binding response OmpR family regulator
VDDFVRLLTTKIEAAGETKLIHTARGIGYSLRVED